MALDGCLDLNGVINMNNDAQEKWLAENTIPCPLGRIPRDTCEAMRARPRFGDALSKTTGETRLMPIKCETCKGWDYWKKLAPEKKHIGPRSQRLISKILKEEPKVSKVEKLRKEEIPETKKCLRCQQMVAVTAFYPSNKSKDGYENICRTCRSEREALVEEARKDPMKVINAMLDGRGEAAYNQGYRDACADNIKFLEAMAKKTRKPPIVADAPL